MKEYEIQIKRSPGGWISRNDDVPLWLCGSGTRKIWWIPKGAKTGVARISTEFDPDGVQIMRIANRWIYVLARPQRPNGSVYEILNCPRSVIDAANMITGDDPYAPSLWVTLWFDR